MHAPYPKDIGWIEVVCGSMFLVGMLRARAYPRNRIEAPANRTAAPSNGPTPVSST